MANPQTSDPSSSASPRWFELTEVPRAQGPVVEPMADNTMEEKGSDVVEGETPQAPLDRVPSQADKMSKKKIVVVMVALCVSSS